MPISKGCEKKQGAAAYVVVNELGALNHALVCLLRVRGDKAHTGTGSCVEAVRQQSGYEVLRDVMVLNQATNTLVTFCGSAFGMCVRLATREMGSCQ